MGTNGSDTLARRRNSDWIDGRGDKDVINGGPGDDPLSSAIGNLDVGPGADVISGGSDGGSFVDILYGGDGNDFISSSYNRPAVRDILSCGAGSISRQSTART
jgi:Ca2+-binding RTX toxin-like protein